MIGVTDEHKQQIEAILSRMTVEQKVAQMIQVPLFPHNRDEVLDWVRRGAGSVLHAMGDDARQLQAIALESGAGVPLLFGIDAVRGHALNRRATVFPSQLACACAWNPRLMRRIGAVTAREVAADGLHWTFSPILCLARDPRWGRVDETFGEDPVLTGRLGAALIHGYQDEPAKGERILACAKHYIAYGEAVGARDACDSEITDRKLREVFLPPFREAVNAGCASIMTAYGSLDGTPLTADAAHLKHILRDELGFDGFVVTDWTNLTFLSTKQHVAADSDEAAYLTAEAGNDMIMVSTEFYDSALRLLREGRLSESVIDDAVRHILTVKARFGLLDQPTRRGDPTCVGCAAHCAAALDAARQSVTLLRNDGTLPVAGSVRRIAVIGAGADDLRMQYGDWTYFTHPERDLARAPERPYVTLREGIESLARDTGREVVYAYGCGPIPSDRDDLDAAVDAAKGADLIVLTVGDEPDQIGEGRDRADLALSGWQTELYHRLRALGRPMVVVLIASKPLALGDAAGANAVVVAFNGGQFGGQAVAEILFGEAEPTGRLPISFPRHSGQVPVYYNSLPGWHGDRYFDLPEGPLFAFGEGLAYTRFAYSDASADAALRTVKVRVTNTGDRPGTETVQLYFRADTAPVMTPVKQLIEFSKVTLAPGQSKIVSLTADVDAFTYVGRDGVRQPHHGAARLMVGHSSRDEELLTLPITLP